jgi:hypothetical protein
MNRAKGNRRLSFPLRKFDENRKVETMQTLQEVNAEELARLFHHYKEALAHDCAPEKEHDSRAWDRTPQSERKLMVAAARLTLLELSTTPDPCAPSRKYFAKPGEADWGC